MTNISTEWKAYKVLLKKSHLTGDFRKTWTDRESLDSYFVERLERLPYIFDDDNINEFLRFFSEFGQGFLKAGYYGGEVIIRVTRPEGFEEPEFV